MLLGPKSVSRCLKQCLSKIRVHKTVPAVLSVVILALLVSIDVSYASPIYNMPYVIDRDSNLYELTLDGHIGQNVTTVQIPSALTPYKHFVEDIAFREGSLYGITHGTTGIEDAARLLSIDYETGQSEIIDLTVKTQQGNPDMLDTFPIQSLTVNPRDGMLYLLGGSLYKIDVESQTATTIDRLHISGPPTSYQWTAGGLAFDARGNLYATISEHGEDAILLAVIDTGTAEVRIIDQILDYHAYQDDTIALSFINGELFGATSTGDYLWLGQSSGDPVDDFRWAGGSSGYVKTTNNGLNMIGMATPTHIPEPATIFLLSFGLIGVAQAARQRAGKRAIPSAG